MSKTCQILGTRAGVGNRVSHSHRKTRRTFAPNLQSKRYWVPSLQRHVTLTVSAKGIKTIDRIGIEAAIARIRRITPMLGQSVGPPLCRRVTAQQTALTSCITHMAPRRTRHT